MNDESEQFRQIAGNYGAMEAGMGQEMYQAHVELARAQADSCRQSIVWAEFRINQVKGMTVIAIAFGLPVYLMFLVWLFKMWVM